MTKQQPDKLLAEQQLKERQQAIALIGKHVMGVLGQPGDLHSVQVRPLWGDHYRVNVLVGADASTAKVAHSFFLVADRDAKIVASTPLITKEY